MLLVGGVASLSNKEGTVSKTHWQIGWARVSCLFLLLAFKWLKGEGEREKLLTKSADVTEKFTKDHHHSITKAIIIMQEKTLLGAVAAAYLLRCAMRIRILLRR